MEFLGYICTIMKKLTLLFIIFTSLYSFGQNQFSKAFYFNNDNDLYTSKFRDRYYTNGMFLGFRYLSKNTPKKYQKRIYEIEIGHEMYTPYKAIVEEKDLHDRPFAGHLFGRFGIVNVDEKKITKASLQLGIVGPDALGYEIQEIIHEIYGFKDVDGWRYQIQNTLAVNFTYDYLKNIHTDKTKTIDFTWVNRGRIGTIYTDVTSGLLMRIGINTLANISNSMEFGSNLNDVSTSSFKQIETYFFFKPSLRYTLYDTTIQGSLFNDQSEVTREIIPIVFNFQAGIKFTMKRFNFGYTFNYHTNKVENLVHENGNIFGTIGLEYMIR